MTKPRRFLRVTVFFLPVLLVPYLPNPSLPGTAEEGEKAFAYFVCDNGLRVVLSKKDSPPLVNISLAVDVGSKDEEPKTSGMVHILEHLILFRGTEYHSGDFIGKELRKHGAYFNGHTDHDLATFEISLPAEHLEFGLKILKEMVFSLKLSPAELEKEKGILLEEIGHIMDDPQRLGDSLALQHLFPDHPYGRPIYGRKEVIEGATVREIEYFYRRYFSPSNCSLAVVGCFNLPETGEKVKEIFGSLKNGEPAPPTRGKAPRLTRAAKLKKNVEVERSLGLEKAHLIFAFSAPPYDHEDQLPVRILTQALGRGVNPLLGGVMRGRQRIAEGISMKYVSLKYGGGVIIRLVLDPKNIKGARVRLLKFLKQAASFRYALDDYLPAQQRHAFDYLATARNQMEYQSEEFREKGINAAVSYARYLLLNEDPEKESFQERLRKVKSAHLRKAVSRYLAGKKYVMIVLK